MAGLLLPFPLVLRLQWVACRCTRPEVDRQQYDADRKFEGRRTECVVQRSATLVQWAMLDGHQESVLTASFPASKYVRHPRIAGRRNDPRSWGLKARAPLGLHRVGLYCEGPEYHQDRADSAAGTGPARTGHNRRSRQPGPRGLAKPMGAYDQTECLIAEKRRARRDVPWIGFNTRPDRPFSYQGACGVRPADSFLRTGEGRCSGGTPSRRCGYGAARSRDALRRLGDG
jgi:hypothetical protein